MAQGNRSNGRVAEDVTTDVVDTGEQEVAHYGVRVVNPAAVGNFAARSGSCVGARWMNSQSVTAPRTVTEKRQKVSPTLFAGKRFAAADADGDRDDGGSLREAHHLVEAKGEDVWVGVRGGRTQLLRQAFDEFVDCRVWLDV